MSAVGDKQFSMSQGVLYPLLIECSRVDPCPERLETYAAEISDWSGALDSAYAHGVFPLVAKTLKNVTAVPETVKQTLKTVNLEIARRNMQMSAELRNVIELLEAHDIQVLALKGPVLSQTIYGDITSRQYMDIDVLIPREQLYAAAEILLGHGYTSEHSIEFLKNRTLLKVAKDFSLFSPESRVHIEFHWQLFLPRQVKKSNIELFSGNNPTVDISGRAVMTLGDDENLIYLLLHGSKHMWERLEWIVDIDRIIRLRHNLIDWQHLNLLAEKMEIKVMYYLGLAITHKVFNTPMPASILQVIKGMEKVQIACEFIIGEMLKGGLLVENTKAFAFRNLYRMRLNKDNRWAIVRHYATTLFQLKDSDVYMVNLPRSLACLYQFTRIYRMAGFYLFGKS